MSSYYHVLLWKQFPKATEESPNPAAEQTRPSAMRSPSVSLWSHLQRLRLHILCSSNAHIPEVLPTHYSLLSALPVLFVLPGRPLFPLTGQYSPQALPFQRLAFHIRSSTLLCPQSTLYLPVTQHLSRHTHKLPLFHLLTAVTSYDLLILGSHTCQVEGKYMILDQMF